MITIFYFIGFVYEVKFFFIGTESLSDLVQIQQAVGQLNRVDSDGLLKLSFSLMVDKPWNSSISYYSNPPCSIFAGGDC